MVLAWMVRTLALPNAISASYCGLAIGTAKGGSPVSRIALYRVCTTFGCRGSAIMKAYNDAIVDGVDVLSLSLGSSAGLEPEFSNNPIAIGAFHAVEKSIIVVCSAGNSGPSPKTRCQYCSLDSNCCSNHIDLDFETDIALGGNKFIKCCCSGNIGLAPAGVTIVLVEPTFEKAQQLKNWQHF